MKTIDPECAPELFRSIGMRPVQSKTFDRGRMECDLVMAHYIKGVGGVAPDKIPDGTLAGALGMSVSYAAGLMYGWDGFSATDVAKPERLKSDELRLGIEHGREAFYQCVKAGLAKVEEKKKSRVAV